jgi:hypothetical protein
MADELAQEVHRGQLVGSVPRCAARAMTAVLTASAEPVVAVQATAVCFETTKNLSVKGAVGVGLDFGCSCHTTTKENSGYYEHW